MFNRLDCTIQKIQFFIFSVFSTLVDEKFNSKDLKLFGLKKLPIIRQDKKYRDFFIFVQIRQQLISGPDLVLKKPFHLKDKTVPNKLGLRDLMSFEVRFSS